MTPSLPRAPQIGSRQVVEHIWIWFSDNGNIRKWDSKPFPEGTEYVAALSRTAQAPVADGVEAGARLIAKWLGYSWDGLHDGSVVAKGFPVFTHGQFGWKFQGHKDDVRALARDILALASSPAMLAAAPSPSSEAVGWRPIETAPHGVEVLLATPPFRCMGEQARWEMRVGCASWGERIGGFSNRSQDAYATHWMPLPTAPVSHGGEHG